MDILQSEVVFVVRYADSGWLIEGPTTIGPFHSRQRALDLADGMAQAIRVAGERARVETR